MILGLVIAFASVAQAEPTPDLTAAASALRGVVLYPDGETSVSKLSVRVWNADTEEVVFKTRTGKDGVFEIPKLPEGNHYVTVGPVRIDMRMLRPRAGFTPQPHGLLIVVPKTMPIANIWVPGAAAAGLVPRVVSP